MKTIWLICLQNIASLFYHNRNNLYLLTYDSHRTSWRGTEIQLDYLYNYVGNIVYRDFISINTSLVSAIFLVRSILISRAPVSVKFSNMDGADAHTSITSWGNICNCEYDIRNFTRELILSSMLADLKSSFLKKNEYFVSGIIRK